MNRGMYVCASLCTYVNPYEGTYERVRVILSVCPSCLFLSCLSVSPSVCVCSVCVSECVCVRARVRVSSFTAICHSIAFSAQSLCLTIKGLNILDVLDSLRDTTDDRLDEQLHQFYEGKEADDDLLYADSPDGIDLSSHIYVFNAIFQKASIFISRFEKK